ncbi:Pyridoxamine 5'-phosphate oxidase [Aquisphaera giovannonii]|uniref:Pyridoxamine 5'-phosphate oxidase n=1 Tax=Aquisphaera giovannonii TaxID=406548 RepID=A0A5B9VWV3_9BACT|nr:pyridoxamine 5'-phosphate oxidase family protein [Aquisphaera giovannonii]QEH32803.1 Pyridoxamine 5'-phosphate oxidase [Aquisphaera giovannonii]
MDKHSHDALAHLVHSQRVASLGTLVDGAPYISLVPFAPAFGPAAFDIHVSRLARHTEGLLAFRRVGLLIAEPDRQTRNPQAIPRLSVQAEAVPLSPGDPEYKAARAGYLERFPAAAMNFDLGDFLLVRLLPHAARFVGGFGRIFDLKAEDLETLAATPPE